MTIGLPRYVGERPDMRIVATEHHLQIERVVHRGTVSASAEFNHERMRICSAHITEGYDPQVIIPTSICTIEEASALAIAIQMAIDWIAEEKARCA